MSDYHKRKIMEFAVIQPSVTGREETHDLNFLALSASDREMECVFNEAIEKLKKRKSGGVIVAPGSCYRYKPYMTDIEENTGDPVKAPAERYLKIPCSCMTPNALSLTEMSRMIEMFRPDAVADVVLQACRSYNIESYKVGEHIQKKHNLSFCKIVTDYSQSDVGQLRTRVEALLEAC